MTRDAYKNDPPISMYPPGMVVETRSIPPAARRRTATDKVWDFLGVLAAIAIGGGGLSIVVAAIWKANEFLWTLEVL